ncbi:MULTISPECIES: hypothetical protein [unclassified Pseudomonas]|uniref:hypothetical protein n=1 Tax=unclassified Pseudomonas TaxID=196821 RepID=UPI001B33DCC5|nr:MULTISPECIES: hypothetical protein [unclassified Pseudomonas]MBP5942939.1 hypothetical protein [Pseudomonas sp. P9(2020)]MBZ9561855.1 hypothetical protein [Pseudomonas sp. P116]
MKPSPKQSLVEQRDGKLAPSNFNAPEQRDIEEKNNILAAIKAKIGERTDEETLDLNKLFASRVTDSTFDHACEFARIELQKLTKRDAFLLLDDRYIFCEETVFEVDENARLRGLDDDFWLDLDNSSGLIEPPDRDWFDMSTDSLVTTYLSEDLTLLAECAANLGGRVLIGKYISVGQWLRFQKHDLPHTVLEARQLIAHLTFKLPSPPPLGNYHELIFAAQDSPFRLTDADRQTIKALIEETTGGVTSLFQHIVPYNNFNEIGVADRRQHAATFIEQFLKKPKAQALGATMHTRLNWNLEQDDSEVARMQIMHLVVSALIIDIIPTLQHHSAVIAGFDMYHPNNASLTPADVVENLEQHLLQTTAIEATNVQIAAHLLLSGTAPEFLIADTPAELTLGKAGWVVLSQTVATIELATPGAARLLSYADIIAFSELSPISSDQRTLQELTSALPVINWAVMNNLVPYTQGKDYSHETFLKAATYFDRYSDALHQSEKGLSGVAPDRTKLSLKALQQVLAPGDYLQRKAFSIKYDKSFTDRNWLDLLGSLNLKGLAEEIFDYSLDRRGMSKFALSELRKLRLSVVDLYMSGDLSENGKLTSKYKTAANFAAPVGAFQRLNELEPAAAIFDRAFTQYYEELQAGRDALIKLAICNLPNRDRQALMNGHVSIYTVRETANPINAFEETQNHRDAKKGRFGVILCTQSAGVTRSYELFTLRGLCRECPELALMLRKTGVINQNPQLSYTGKKTDFQKKNQDHVWPLDFSAYASGSEPRSGMTSSVVVEKLCQMHLQADNVGQVALFFAPALKELTDWVLTYHPVLTREEMYASLNTQTELQVLRQHNRVVDKFLVDLVVPFKKCIEDIQSGDAPRVSEGIGGCILDGLALVGLLVGLGVTVANIVTKSVSTTAKVLSIAKASLRFAVAVVNPLDGLPDLAQKGARLAKRGALLLSQRSSQALEVASSQIRRLSGSSQSYDLIKAAKRTDLMQGQWKAVDDLAEPLELVALQRNNEWHALHFKTGGAWGPKLPNFKILDFSPLRRFFARFKPHGYTRRYLKRSLPLAKSKLDNAISVCTDPNWEAQVRLVFEHVFGTYSDDALKHVLQRLRAMRHDLNGVSLANMSFKKDPVNALAALRTTDYKQWKAARKNVDDPAGSFKRFLKIFPDQMDEFYRTSRYDDSRIADVLIHELSHGAPGTLDLYYGHVTPFSQLDVTSLVDLARSSTRAHPRFPDNPHAVLARPGDWKILDSSAASQPLLVRQNPALLNADSYELAVGLLDQIKTERPMFELNIDAIRFPVYHAHPERFLDQPVLVNLGTPIT